MTLRARAVASIVAVPAALLAVTLAVVASLLAAAPAQAAKASYDDPADATASPTDIRTVLISHTKTRVRVVVGFTDLRRRFDEGSAGLMIGLDVDRDRRGADYRLSTGLQAGTDYQLLQVRRGRVVGEPLTCAHRVRLRFARDLLVFRAARGCIGTPDSVRIGVKMRDARDGSRPVVDWLGAPRSFTDWVESA